MNAAAKLIRLFTLRGSCDVDDLILNVLGAILCYNLSRQINKFEFDEFLTVYYPL